MISFNWFLMLFVAIFLFSLVFELVVSRINIGHLRRHGEIVPAAFEGFLDLSDLKRINRYTIDNHRLGLLQTVVDKFFFLALLLCGLLPFLANRLSPMTEVLAGLIFFGLLGIASAMVDLPFGYYHKFVIEQRWGFNTQTVKDWIIDLVKGVVLAAFLGGILLGAMLFLVTKAGGSWWVWTWGFFFGFQLIMIVIYPNLIAPIFNKFTPLPESELKSRIEHLAQSQGLPISGIYQMDASRRTKHTNAYFAGLGRTKRIVLYDSLLAVHSPDEIVAILAHEIGHFKKGHLKIQLLLTCLSSFLLLGSAALLLKWEGLYTSFGFEGQPVYAGLFLVGVLWGPVGYFLSPISMALSRRFERQADDYALNTIKDAAPLISAFKKMARENLANLWPHPIFVRFNYSHPPLPERVSRLTGQTTH